MRTSYISDRAEIDNVIKQCDICFVGLISEDEFPYVIPMNFGYDGKDFFMHSGEGKHVELLNKNNHVCMTFCTDRKLRYQHPDVACSYSMTSQSVVCKGSVSFITEDDLAEKERILNIIMKNYSTNEFKYSEPALKNVRVWRITIHEITAKSFGQHFKD